MHELPSNLISFGEAAKLLPTKNGKRISTCSLWRWARKGCRGVMLATWRLGGNFYTTPEAIAEFARELAAVPLRDIAPIPRPAPKPIRAREASMNRAAKVLERAGI